MKRKAPRPPGPRTPGKSDGLQSLQTAFRILDELSHAHGPVPLTDLATQR